ncbi:MAG: hypothetical protein ACREF0_08750, partial [Acetobacteraceae bacterium]
MLRRISTRVVSMIVAVFTVLSVIFFSIRLGTGDPTAAIQGSYATAASIAALRHALGLNQPLLQQYLIYLTGLVHGNFSVSLQNGQSVLHQIIAVVPYTFDLTVSGLSIGLVLGV